MEGVELNGNSVTIEQTEPTATQYQGVMLSVALVGTTPATLTTADHGKHRCGRQGEAHASE